MTSDSLKFGSNSLIHFSILAFHIFGVWPRNHSTVIYTIIGYAFHILFSAGWTVAKCIGTAMLEKRSDLILLGPSSLYCCMSTLRIFIVMYNFKNIKRNYDKIVEFAVNIEEFEDTQIKIKTFSRNSVAYVVFLFSALGSAVFEPFLKKERMMPIPIWFPLDYRNNVLYFWIGYWFSFFGILSLVVLDSFIPIFTWFLIYSNALKLKMLGNRISKLGYDTAGESNHLAKKKDHQKAYWSLYGYIKLHKQIVEDISDIQNIFSVIFLILITSSAICICSVTYLMASERLVNNINTFVMYISLMGIYIYEIFVLMYYGNEVTLASSDLFLKVYQSNWIDSSVRYRKMAIIFMERLKKPQEMKIGKVFPLNLKTLTSILNAAYSFFNLLRSNEQGKSSS